MIIKYSHVVVRGCLVFVALIALPSCMSVKDGRTLRKDLFNANTRIIALEKQLLDETSKSQNSGKAASMRIASSTTKMDRLERDVRKMRGEVDTLRVGVVTGQMPGQSSGQGSIAETLESIKERLVKVEETQSEILSSLEKRSKRKKRSQKKNSQKLKKLTDFKSAFTKKRYKQINQDISKTIKKSKGKEKQELKFIQAESMFKLGAIREAALKFNQYSESYPSDSRMHHIQMRMGDCFKFLGDLDTAKIYYQEVIDKYPNSNSAKTSTTRLNKLKKKSA